MGDSLISIITIVLAVILMFVFPLMTMSEKTDDLAQLSVQIAAKGFLDTVRSTGKIDINDYESFIDKISSTGNTFDIQMEIQVLDENPAVNTTQAQKAKIGENRYYSLYTNQIEEQIGKNGAIYLKEGDKFSISVNNTNKTISQILKNFFYQISGNGTYQIRADYSGLVSMNGTEKAQTNVFDNIEKKNINNADVEIITAVDVLKPGDYVKYPTPSNSFTLSGAETGCQANQTFNTGSYSGLWQVLYNDVENGLQLISAGTVGTVRLKGRTGYNNVTTALNKFARYYEHNAYAVQNRARVVGTDPTNPDKEYGTYLLKFQYNNSSLSGCYQASNDYTKDFNAMKNATSQNASGIVDCGNSYWLGSRIITEQGTSRVIFGIRYLGVNGQSGTAIILYMLSNNNDYNTSIENSLGVRPIIYLKPEIEIKKGNGSAASPYELQ